IIIALAACAAYIDWPNNHGIHFLGIDNSLQVRQGLDLQGGVSVLLVPDPAQHYTQDELNNNIGTARDQIEQRVNGGLGVNEPSIRIQTSNNQPSISVELPGLNSGNQFDAINTLLKTGNLEFWNTGQTPVQEGTTLDPAQFGGKAVFSGKDLDPSQIGVSNDQTGRPQINFEMKGDAIARFGTFTGNNVNNFLTITLDGTVISSARINNAINGPGVITGQFTLTQAQ